MVNWEEVRATWETSSISFKDLAEKYDVKDATIRSRKNREKWQRNNATQRATKNKSVATEKKTKQRKRSGNPNPKNTFAERNSKALKHGLFSRYMPQETLDIMGMIAGSDPIDLLWMQIELQFAAIIRAQEIMFVNDRNDTVKVTTKERSDDFGSEESFEYQFAWERHALFMNAQSKAMGELRGLIKQFDEMAHIDDERRLKLQMMQGSIDKTKAEIEKLNGNNDEGPIEIMISRKGGR